MPRTSDVFTNFFTRSTEIKKNFVFVICRGRVDHNRHFTIKDTTMEDVITFVPNGMSGSFTTDSCPFAACGPWLHIQLDEVARKNISEDVEFLFSSEAVNVSLIRSN